MVSQCNVARGLTTYNKYMTITCKCGATLGEVVDLNGLTMLRIGKTPFLLPEAKAICLQCGRVIYWSTSGKIMSRIIREAMVSQTLHRDG